MRRRPPRSKRTDTLFPDTTLVRSLVRTRIRAPPGRGPRLGLRRAPARMAGTRSAGALGLAGGTCGDQGHGRGAAQRLALDLVRRAPDRAHRSEEHTSELQSLMRISYAVFCLQKKKTQNASS